MTQEQRYDAETLATLACDIGARPAAAERVAALVAAERLCCAGIDWHIEGPVPGDSTTAGTSARSLRLRVEASPAQLDIVQRLFAGADDVAQGP